MDCMLDCIYTVRNQGDMAWYELSVHIRDKLKPFLRLMKEMMLLTDGEIPMKDSKGVTGTYKG